MKNHIFLLITAFALFFYSCEDILRLPEFAPFSFETIIESVYRQPNDQLGSSVCIDNSTAIIGLPYSSIVTTNGGAVCIYDQNAHSIWAITQVLFASDTQPGDFFGRSVSISGNYAIAGAPYEDTGGSDAGAAYVFEWHAEYERWIQKAPLHVPLMNTNARFGTSVSISSNYAIVGAPGENTGGSNAGAAYVFERDGSENWIQKQSLYASDAQEMSDFGYSVSISGNYAVIGAMTTNNWAGAAYIFERDVSGSWNEVTILHAPSPQVDDFFGYSVSISGNYVIIGTPWEDTGGNNTGAAYVFERDDSGNWIQKPPLYASDAQENDWFGDSVSISGNYAIVGAHMEDTGGSSNAGAAYVFERDGFGNWNEISILHTSDAQAEDYFGWSVSISGSRLISGAPQKGPYYGGAYIYESFYGD